MIAYLIIYIRFEKTNLCVENENPSCVQVAQKENRKFYMIYYDIQSLQNVTKILVIYVDIVYHN